MQSIAKLLCETARSPFPKNNRLTEAGGPDASHSGGTHSVFYCQPLPKTTPPGRPTRCRSARENWVLLGKIRW